jgi:hypothetical protein
MKKIWKALTAKELWDFESNKKSYLLFTVVIPLLVILFFAFVTQSGAYPTVEWQTGQWNDYVEIFLFFPSLAYILPFMFFSIISITLLAADYRRYKKYFLVRLGIYTGALIAWEYAILGHFALINTQFFYFTAIALLLLWIAHIICKKLEGWKIAMLVIIIGLLFEIYGLSQGMGLGGIFMMTAIVVVTSIIGSPAWAAFFATLLSWKLLHEKPSKEGEWVGHKIEYVLLYIVTYATALSFAIEEAVKAYYKLPVTPPSSCYVATAASKGHRKFVGSQTTIGANGEQFLLNRQLQYCKYVELTIRAISPKTHRWLRTHYNTIGQRLAKRIHNPWAADAAFLLLKPVEWIGVVLLAMMPRHKVMVQKLYKP